MPLELIKLIMSELIVKDSADVVKGNTLFPIFCKLDRLQTLVIGGGNVGTEKLRALLGNDPNAPIKLVATEIKAELKSYLEDYPNVQLIERPFAIEDLDGIDLLIVAVNNREISRAIAEFAKKKQIPVNVADTPDLCDFYLSSIVQKGQVKLAISTNGYSPTLAKRLKEYFDAGIPDEINETAVSLLKVRQGLNGTFNEKVKRLNEITASLVAEPQEINRFTLKTIFIWSLGILGLMITGHLLFSLIPIGVIGESAIDVFHSLGENFFYFVIGGFCAQMIDGCLSMAYGVSANTLLMAFGVPPAAASASVHTSEIFTSGVSGLMHLKFGNVNNKLFKTLLLPGILGAIAGAYILSSLEVYVGYLKPVVAIYTAILGILIIRKVIRKKIKKKPVKNVGWLASAGGFLDAIGGGGWGPVVASTLIARGRHPMYTVGSVCLAEFFVSLASSVTFITLIGFSHWQVILGLVLGGVIASPIAAYFSKKIPVKTLMLVVGVAVIAISLRTVFKSLGVL